MIDPPPNRRSSGSITTRTLAFLLFALAAIAIWNRSGDRETPLPDLGAIHRFELTDQLGRDFSADELRGRAWLANFIFTRCLTICPALTGQMREIQEETRELGDRFQLVSFSVDPDFDTPEILKEYARQHRADEENWSFLTGPLEELRLTIVEGFKIVMARVGDDYRNSFHGSHFVLVDGAGRIRAYYDPKDEDFVERVGRGVRSLLAEER